MAAATFERQAELLETIHRAARELRELAGDALEIIVRPAAKSAPRVREPNPVSGRVVDATLDVFRQRAGQWLARSDIVDALNTNPTSAGRALRKLADEGAIEHNNRNRAGRRYRLPETELPGGGFIERLPGVSACAEERRARRTRTGRRAAGSGRAAGACASRVRGGGRDAHRTRDAARPAAPRRRLVHRAAARPGPDREVRAPAAAQPRRLRSRR